MEIIVFLSIVIAVVAVLTSIVLVRRVKKQIAEMTDVLVDVKNGNGNRRILSATNELTAPLAYEINEIVVSYESRLSTVRQTEETNRQLMTSLSHDVRTPLTTLIGYLDAAHKGLVTGKDRDDYIETARRKAHDLKEYIDVLFDWFKLNSNEFALEIQSVEAAELTRNILIDWIPIFEDKQVDYDIDIPEQPVRVRLDMDSYMRIVNNLIQNVIAHSHADKIKIVLSKKENNMELLLADNGVGIEKDDLKHIFERLYKCDKGRSEKGSGLGLSIQLQVSDIPKASLILERQFHVTDYAVQDEHNLRLYDTALDMAAINKALVVQDVAVISSQICNDTLEDEAVFVALSPHELYERKVTMQELHAAITSLPDKQAKRIYAHFILGMTKQDIARAEGVHEKVVRVAIERGLRHLEKILKNSL